MSLAQLPNLGPKSAEMLADAGITTREELEACGVVKAFVAVEQHGHSPSLNLLWAMEGALTDTPWELIEPDLKEQLKEELEKVRHDTH